MAEDRLATATAALENALWRLKCQMSVEEMPTENIRYALSLADCPAVLYPILEAELERRGAVL